jgi:plastocyanin
VVTQRQYVALAAISGGLALALACGGSSTSPSPTPGGGGGSAGPVGATITINASGVLTPSTVTINPGESVAFVNSHNRPHQMSSDPHPNHTECPAINSLPTLGAGQSGQTSALTTSRTCGIHDHLDDGNASLQGRIVIR